MAGLTLIFDRHPNRAAPLTPQTAGFRQLNQATARFKGLAEPPEIAAGPGVVAAKFNTPASRHPQIVRDQTDPANPSWLLAVGTIIDRAAPNPADLHPFFRAFLRDGPAALDRLDGHFILALHDGPRRQTHLITDPLGMLACFFAEKDGRVIVSTSALAVAQLAQATLDEFGPRYFLLHGSVFGPHTLWRGVNRLEPAARFTLSETGLAHHTYWQPQLDSAISKLNLDDTVSRVINDLTAPLTPDLAPDHLWLSLTGGFDSRVLAALADHTGLQFETYTHGPPDARDVRLAADLSRALNWSHRYFPLPDDWGVQRADWLLTAVGRNDGHLDVLKNSRLLREQAEKAQTGGVSMWGFGGEVFRGYHWKQEFFNAGRSDRVNYDRLLDYRLFPSTGPALLRDEANWRQTIRAELKRTLLAVGEADPAWPNTAKLDRIGKYFDHTWGGAHLSAAIGWQRALAPYTFRQSVQTVLSTNHRWRTYDRLFRHILLRVNRTLAHAPTAEGGPALPITLLTLPRFTPYALGLAEKVAWRAAYKLTGRSLWRRRDAGPAGSAYPTRRWLRETLDHLPLPHLLNPARMRSADLYQSPALTDFVAAPRRDDFNHEALLSRVLTIELATRLVAGETTIEG